MADQAVERVIGWRKLSSGIYIDPKQYEQTHINEVISSADRFSNWARAQADGSANDFSVEQSDKFRFLSVTLAWFREKKDCNTMGDVFQRIRNREIELPIIELWAYENFSERLPPSVLNREIIAAYPEVADFMNRQQQKAISESLARSLRMIQEA